VTGGISAYKCCTLVRLLVETGAAVQVVMTDAATRFVTPLTFSTLSGRQTLTELFPKPAPTDPLHLQTAHSGDILVVAPATADFIGKMAHGLADDLASNVVLAFQKPILLAPAMNTAMWIHPAVQTNVSLLRDRGVHFVGPDEGKMAGRQESSGVGRMSQPETIFAAIEALLSDRTRWQNRRVIVASGPTREALDPVRYVSNRSSGKMGDAVARQAYLRGAEVTLIRTASSIGTPPEGPRVVTVGTAEEMFSAVKSEFDGCDVLVMAAAVADWRLEQAPLTKIKKKDGLPRFAWHRTDDILKWAGSHKKQQIIVGFAVETERHIEEATLKLTSKNADIIALNDPTQPESAFGGNTIKLTLLQRSGAVSELPALLKPQAAEQLLDRVEKLFS